MFNDAIKCTHGTDWLLFVYASAIIFAHIISEQDFVSADKIRGTVWPRALHCKLPPSYFKPFNDIYALCVYIKHSWFVKAYLLYYIVMYCSIL